MQSGSTRRTSVRSPPASRLRSSSRICASGNNERTRPALERWPGPDHPLKQQERALTCIDHETFRSDERNLSMLYVRFKSALSDRLGPRLLEWEHACFLTIFGLLLMQPATSMWTIPNEDAWGMVIAAMGLIR